MASVENAFADNAISVAHFAEIGTLHRVREIRQSEGRGTTWAEPDLTTKTLCKTLINAYRADRDKLFDEQHNEKNNPTLHKNMGVW